MFTVILTHTLTQRQYSVTTPKFVTARIVAHALRINESIDFATVRVWDCKARRFI